MATKTTAAPWPGSAELVGLLPPGLEKYYVRAKLQLCLRLTPCKNLANLKGHRLKVQFWGDSGPRMLTFPESSSNSLLTGQFDFGVMTTDEKFDRYLEDASPLRALWLYKDTECGVVIIDDLKKLVRSGEYETFTVTSSVGIEVAEMQVKLLIRKPVVESAKTKQGRSAKLPEKRSGPSSNQGRKLEEISCKKAANSQQLEKSINLLTTQIEVVKKIAEDSLRSKEDKDIFNRTNIHRSKMPSKRTMPTSSVDATASQLSLRQLKKQVGMVKRLTEDSDQWKKDKDFNPGNNNRHRSNVPSRSTISVPSASSTVPQPSLSQLREHIGMVKGSHQSKGDKEILFGDNNQRPDAPPRSAVSVSSPDPTAPQPSSEEPLEQPSKELALDLTPSEEIERPQPQMLSRPEPKLDLKRFMAKITIAEGREISNVCASVESQGQRHDAKKTIAPSTYVTFDAFPSGHACSKSPYSTKMIEKSRKPVWNYSTTVYLSSSLLTNHREFFIVKLWHTKNVRSPEDSQLTIGYAAVDLAPLRTKNFSHITGWYHIHDFTGKCRGQIHVTVEPLEPIDEFRESPIQPDFSQERGFLENYHIQSEMNTLNEDCEKRSTEDIRFSPNDLENHDTTIDSSIICTSSQATSSQTSPIHWKDLIIPVDLPADGADRSTLNRRLVEMEQGIAEIAETHMPHKERPANSAQQTLSESPSLPSSGTTDLKSASGDNLEENVARTLRLLRESCGLPEDVLRTDIESEH